MTNRYRFWQYLMHANSYPAVRFHIKDIFYIKYPAICRLVPLLNSQNEKDRIFMYYSKKQVWLKTKWNYILPAYVFCEEPSKSFVYDLKLDQSYENNVGTRCQGIAQSKKGWWQFVTVQAQFSLTCLCFKINILIPVTKMLHIGFTPDSRRQTAMSTRSDYYS